MPRRNHPKRRWNGWKQGKGKKRPRGWHHTHGSQEARRHVRVLEEFLEADRRAA